MRRISQAPHHLLVSLRFQALHEQSIARTGAQDSSHEVAADLREDAGSVDTREGIVIVDLK